MTRLPIGAFVSAVALMLAVAIIDSPREVNCTGTGDQVDSGGASGESRGIGRYFSTMFNFDAFKKKFSKNYKSVGEELRRKALFLAACLKVLPIKAAYKVGLSTFSVDVNEASDMTQEERRIRKSGVRKPGKRDHPAAETAKNKMERVIESLDVPADKDEEELEVSMQMSRSSARSSADQMDPIKARRQEGAGTQVGVDLLLLDRDYLEERIERMLDSFQENEEMYDTLLEQLEEEESLDGSAHETMSQMGRGDASTSSKAKNESEDRRSVQLFGMSREEKAHYDIVGSLKDFVVSKLAEDPGGPKVKNWQNEEERSTSQHDGSSEDRDDYSELSWDYNRKADLLDSLNDYELAPVKSVPPKAPKVRSRKEKLVKQTRAPSEQPEQIDWSQDECMMPALDQGVCGSCYAHAAVSMVEFHLCRKGLLAKGERLSREMVLDCGPQYSDALLGCGGGDSNVTLNMMADLGYVWRERDYIDFYTRNVLDLGKEPKEEVDDDDDKPEVVSGKMSPTDMGETGGGFVVHHLRREVKRFTTDRCPFSMAPRSKSLASDMLKQVAEQSVSGSSDMNTTSYKLIPSSFSYKIIARHEHLKRRLQYGPVALKVHYPEIVDDYSEGIYDGQDCLADAAAEVNLHVMLAVGYGRLGHQEYYIIRNSFGPQFGINGNILWSTEVPKACFKDAFYIVDQAPPKVHLASLLAWESEEPIEAMASPTRSKEHQDQKRSRLGATKKDQRVKTGGDDEQIESDRGQGLGLILDRPEDIYDIRNVWASLNLFDISLAERLERGNSTLFV